MFLKDSDWNFAFNSRNYFNVSNDVSVEFGSVGTGNSNGKLINHSFNGDDVYFKPVAGYSGGIEFSLVAKSVTEDVFSNNFAVNITRYNEAPFFSMNIPFISIAADGEESID